MKRKYFIIGIIIIVILGGVIYKLKTNKKYHIDEKVTLDNYGITLKKANYNEETKTLEAVFQITNLNKYSITINDREHFMLNGLGETEIGNSFHSNINLIKSNETIMYTLNYSVNKNKKYIITFYSGVKKNNAKFIIDLKE